MLELVEVEVLVFEVLLVESDDELLDELDDVVRFVFELLEEEVLLVEELDEEEVDLVLEEDDVETVDEEVEVVVAVAAGFTDTRHNAQA